MGRLLRGTTLCECAGFFQTAQLEFLFRALTNKIFRTSKENAAPQVSGRPTLAWTGRDSH